MSINDMPMVREAYLFEPVEAAGPVHCGLVAEAQELQRGTYQFSTQDS